MSGDFPAHRAHAGLWQGTYRHMDADGAIEQVLQSKVWCAFPSAGPIFYTQEIELTDAAGLVMRAAFHGLVRGDHVWFDTETFTGKSWETADGVVLLNLQRKDEPGAHFVEVIVLGAGGHHRARTWHWFREGRLFRRTLCDETRLA